ncbi:MAG TPA: glycoside hydrolase family 15 protein [Caulobacteraceae bacterium]|jgi:GH15 family glucan-1,4-alpha-glucosidase|nr:glycoside hydrolase family 15 protein [Caulobacteraceae bacterium]
MSIDLDLAPVGNGTISALVDLEGRFVWCCAPRVDSDPFFSCLLSGVDPARDEARGVWSIDVEDAVQTKQAYLRNTPVLRTVITDSTGGCVEVTDFAPRFKLFGRTFRPTAFFRIVRPLSGAPRIRVRMNPTAHYGAALAQTTSGSNHIRYTGADATLRLTTDLPVSHIVEERIFRLESAQALFLGPDEPFQGEVLSTADTMLRDTCTYWREWVRTLAVPLEWQEAVIRAAITLKLCAYEETGAIVAALTTSIPEAPGTGRNWDYRYCWIRDAYYVVQALNRLGAVDILENYLGYLRNIVDAAGSGRIQPLYGVGFEPIVEERIIDTLPGYRGMGPVRAGNAAYVQSQNDVYGQIILSNTQAFFDTRLLRPATIADFEALERIGERAFAVYETADAGLWELRTRAGVHTYSAAMCWAACDRLGNCAQQLGLPARADYWNQRAEVIRLAIEEKAWNEEAGHFAATFGGDELDASLTQLVDLRFLRPDDPRHRKTLEAIGKQLRRGSVLLRYAIPDDFGAPETAFNFCTFWFIESLYLVGEVDEARRLFEEMLAKRTHAGLLSEDVAFDGGALWGNYPQTYSLVGLINCAVLLSRPWSSVR